MSLNDLIILVIPNNIKEEILLKINELDNIYNIKIMNLSEFINKLTFTYDDKSIYYLINKYKIKYEVAKVYLDNIKYIENSNSIKKLNKLYKIKQELIDNNLLIYDDLFKSFIKDKKIIIYGYDYLNKYQKKVLINIDYNFIKKEKKDYKHDVYEFDTIDEEVEFVCTKIIESGIDINKIKLANITSEYNNVVQRIFKFYNIPILLENNMSIYDTNIISDFINLIKEKDIDEVLNILNSKYDFTIDENNYIYNKLINILNKYTFVDNYIDVLDMLIYDFKHTNNYVNKIDNCIRVIDIKNNIIDDDTYVFLLGFNQGSLPIIYKDEDYITDDIKGNLNIETTIEKNKIEKDNIKNIISSIKNLTLTYKLKSSFETYYKSYLIDELNLNVIKNYKIKNVYSNQINKIHLSEKLDKLIKFSNKDEDLDILYNTYNNIDYLTFNNKFKGINKNDLYKYLDNKLLLSYTSLDNYYRCSFRYYLNNILKLTDFESKFATTIGNIFHYVLSKCFESDFNFEKEFNESIKDLDLSIKDKFFLSKLKDELLFVINTINMQNKFSTLNNGLYENKIYINKEGNIKLTFIGVIDKLLYKNENDKTYLVIIDYKTGSLHTNLNNTIYGIDMQLPVYLYLASNTDTIKNATVIGFYLQKILNNEIIKQDNKSYEKQKKDNLKLQGYSINDENLLEKFDSTYKDSEVIKSMKVGNNGFYSYSKTISQSEINKLIQITESNINKAFNDILDAKFDINPKRIGKNNVGCEFCKYKDICYMKEEDIVNLEEYKDLEFLK